MALKVLQFCAQADAHARRYITILESFNDTIHASHKAKMSARGSSDDWSIFNVLFGGDGVQVDPEPSFTQNSMGTGLVSSWPVGEAASDDAIRLLPEDQKAIEVAAWPASLSGLANEPIDFDGIGWPDAQDNFELTNDVRVPLYGLMEPY
jgi:hypothetical protein